MAPRSWDARSTLSTHSYLRPDGVPVEHMVALANKVRHAEDGLGSCRVQLHCAACSHSRGILHKCHTYALAWFTGVGGMGARKGRQFCALQMSWQGLS